MFDVSALEKPEVSLPNDADFVIVRDGPSFFLLVKLDSLLSFSFQGTLSSNCFTFGTFELLNEFDFDRSPETKSFKHVKLSVLEMLKHKL